MAVLITLANRATIDEPLPKAVIEDLQNEFTHTNPEFEKLKALGFRKRVPRYIATWQADNRGISFPRGGVEKVRSILETNGFASVIEDERSNGDQSLGKIPKHRITLYPFQEQMVTAAIENETCLLRAPQGSGKTTAALSLAARLQLPTLVIVSTTNLLDQWMRRCVNELGLFEQDVGVIQGGRVRLRPITIGMQQSLRKHATKIASKFGTVIADEVQLFAASTFQDVIDVLDSRYRIGVSGDERRADRKEFLIYDQFGEVAHRVEHQAMVDAGYVHEVEIRVVPTAFEADWFANIREPKKRVKKLDALYDQMAQDSDRNALAIECVRQSVQDEGEQAIILSLRREHCHVLDSIATRSGLRSGLFIGGDDYREQFEQTLRGMNARETEVAVGTYQAIGVGFDAPRVARGVCSMPVANNSKGEFQFRQYRGRFARVCEGKRDAILYYLLDVNVFGLTPLRNLCKWNARVSVWDASNEAWINARSFLDGKKKKRRESNTHDPKQAKPGRRKRSQVKRAEQQELFGSYDPFNGGNG